VSLAKRGRHRRREGGGRIIPVVVAFEGRLDFCAVAEGSEVLGGPVMNKSVSFHPLPQVSVKLQQVQKHIHVCLFRFRVGLSSGVGL